LFFEVEIEVEVEVEVDFFHTTDFLIRMKRNMDEYRQI